VLSNGPRSAPAAEAPRPRTTPAYSQPTGERAQDLSDMEIPTFIRRQMD
jgi:hypothetical protein